MSCKEGIEKLVILDAGAQYAKVIDRRVRELAVHSTILPLETPADKLKADGYKAIIISGGPESVYAENAPKYDPGLFELGIPIFGICYGMQLLNKVHGGSVLKKSEREDGVFKILTTGNSLLFDSLDVTQTVLLTHGDSVSMVAPGFRCVGKSSSGIVSAIDSFEKKMYGVQFHPEVDLTVHGKEMFSNFLFKVAGFSGNFTMVSRKDAAIKLIRETVGDASVLTLVSGGVDSTVCTALLREALPHEKIFALHLDSGFMRKNESSNVKLALEAIGVNLKVVDATETFANATTEIRGKKTKRLCETIDVEARRFGLDPKKCFLAQGTLRPDLIESASKIASGSGNAHCIKTHHNDTQLVRALREQGRIIEPLKDYHKDEVRALGMDLGLSESLVWRQPFPGPGLAIRIICADKPFLPAIQDDTTGPIKIAKKLQKVVETVCSRFSTSQTFTENKIKRQKTLPSSVTDVQAILLPCRSVGVQGDCRSYKSLCALSWSGKSSINWKLLLEIAREIPKLIHHVNRVVFLFGDSMMNGVSSTITPTRLEEPVINMLREADAIVNELLLKHKLTRKLSQVPVILFPAEFGLPGKRSIAIRTFITRDFMTGLPAQPGKDIQIAIIEEMARRILTEVEGIGRVTYDLTSKPPATTEWE